MSHLSLILYVFLRDTSNITRLFSYYLIFFTRKSRKTQGKILSKHIACVVLHAMSINNSSYKKIAVTHSYSHQYPFPQVSHLHILLLHNRLPQQQEHPVTCQRNQSKHHQLESQT